MTLTFDNEDAVTNWALAWLRERGFAIFQIGREPYLTPKEIGGEYDFTGPQICHLLHHVQCPETPRRHGPKGRLLAVLVTPELRAWLAAKAKEVPTC